MKSFTFVRLLIFAGLFSLTIPAFADFSINVSDQERGAAKKSAPKGKSVRSREPRAVLKAKKKQEKNQKKLKLDYVKFVRNNQKRSQEIQTPVVRERMKQNVKDANSNAKAKKKNIASRSKKAGRKYGR
jgi:hypothetical protein